MWDDRSDGPALPGRLTCMEVYWRTPKYVLQVASLCLGGIGFDPATDEDNWTGAEEYLTQFGLTSPWKDRVFVNPPYGPALPDWCERVATEAESGKTIFLLLPGNRYSTQYSQRLQRSPALRILCNVDHRIAFIDRNGNEQPCNMYGSTIFGFNNANWWALKTLGACFKPMGRP